MKLLVETTGPFGLNDLSVGQSFHHDRPTVAINSVFLREQVERKKLAVLVDDLPEDADDADFATAYAKDPEAAVEALKPKTEPKKVAKPKAE